MGQAISIISEFLDNIQGSLFLWLEEELDPLSEKQRQLVTILELVRIEEFLPETFRVEGRPKKTRRAIARAFIAKSRKDSTQASKKTVQRRESKCQENVDCRICI